MMLEEGPDIAAERICDQHLLGKADREEREAEADIAHPAQ